MAYISHWKFENGGGGGEGKSDGEDVSVRVDGWGDLLISLAHLRIREKQGVQEGYKHVEKFKSNFNPDDIWTDFCRQDHIYLNQREKLEKNSNTRVV